MCAFQIKLLPSPAARERRHGIDAFVGDKLQFAFDAGGSEAIGETASPSRRSLA